MTLSGGPRWLLSAGWTMANRGFAIFTALSSCTDGSLSSTEARLQSGAWDKRLGHRGLGCGFNAGGPGMGWGSVRLMALCVLKDKDRRPDQSGIFQR